MTYDPKELSVLVVDDHDPMRKAMKRVLSIGGITNVKESHDGSDAIEKLKRENFDLVLCDLFMKHTSGFDVLSYVRGREIGNDIPFIVVTGEASKQDIIRCSDLGADSYVLKPFNAPDMIQTINKVLDTYFSPHPVLNAVRIAEKLIFTGESEKAEAIFKKVLSSGTKSPRAQYGLAMALEKSGRSIAAEKLLQENISQYPDYFRNYKTMANLMLKNGDTNGAIHAMSLELSINEKLPERQVELAALLIKKEQFDKAIEHLKLAIKHDPKNEQALFILGHTYADKEDIDKAFQIFKRIRRNNPKNTKALRSVVLVSGQLKQLDKAELFLKDERNHYPNRLDTYSVLAKLLIILGKEDEALKALKTLFLKSPDNLEGLHVKGFLELRQQKFTEAIGTFTRLTEGTSDVEGLIGLSDAYLGNNQTEECITVLNKAVQIEPNSSKVVQRQAQAFRVSTQFLKAALTYQKALKLGAKSSKNRKFLDLSVEEVMIRRSTRGWSPKKNHAS